MKKQDKYESSNGMSRREDQPQTSALPCPDPYLPTSKLKSSSNPLKLGGRHY